jgi:hypothetical protein
VLPTAPTSTAPDPGCARCPLTHGEPNNQRRRGHWVQPVTWVPASICVREKPNGNSFCRAPVGAGQPNPPTTTQQETRPRSGPPSSWANQSPKMTTTAPFGAGHQGEPTSRWTCTEDTGRSPGPSGSGKRPAASVRRTTAASGRVQASGSGKAASGKTSAAQRRPRPRQPQRQAASRPPQNGGHGRVQASGSGKAAAVKRRRAGWWAGPSPLLGKRKSVVQLS